MRTSGPVLRFPRPAFSQRQKLLAHRRRIGILLVRFEEFFSHPPPVQAPQQKSRRCFHKIVRGAPQHVRKPDVRRILAQTNRVRQICVGMIFHHEVRRPAFAAQARVDALK